MNVSKLALASATLLGGAALAPASAGAQYSQPTAPPQAQQPVQPPQAEQEQGSRQERRRRGQQAAQPAGPQLSAEERAALLPLQTAVQAQDWAAATAALPAAQATATGPQALYMLGNFQFRVGQGTQNAQLQAQGVDTMLASGATPPENLRVLLGAQSGFAINAENWPVAEQALTRYLEQDSANTERLYQLAEVKIRLNKYDEALALYQRLIQAGEAGGAKAPEDHYRRALTLARQLRSEQLTADLSRTLLSSYPTPDNWRSALSLYRQETANDADLAIDLRRLMRTAQAFNREADYIEFADKLLRAGLVGEAKSLLDEGVSRGVLRSSDATVSQLLASAGSRAEEDRASLGAARTRAMAASTGREARITADAYLGYGQYSDSIALYRAALQKGGENADLVNMRLGIALALAGQRAEAETAFRAVTGSRTQLANYWLLWLARAGS